MYLPLKKDYPDYYKVITDPIDLSTIETKIKSNKVNQHRSHETTHILRYTAFGMCIS